VTEPTFRTALIQGASRGLGLEIARQLAAEGTRVFGTCRQPGTAGALQQVTADVVRLDLADESTIAAAAETVGSETDALDLVMNVSGLLHDGALQPEKRLEDLESTALARLFQVNAIGPALVAKHMHRLLKHDRRAVLANVSARVGSIEDNRLGGWYGYRASKAAQNMLTKTMAIELGRRAPNAIVLALHPGTVDTDLSKPFQRNVPEGKLFSVERAAGQLLAIVRDATEEDHGSFRAWDDSPIPW